jgi:hypothetical protein
MSLQLHRPDGRGGLEPAPVRDPNWRRHLQSRRWGMNRRDGKLPRLDNPEMNPTTTPFAILFWVSLAVATFVLIVLGYGTGFWHFPVEAAASGVPVVTPAP